MTTTTSDPVVAVVYGAMTYPSLRPGVAAATDLVAGQPGPWVLSDDALAAQATSLVARLRDGSTPTPADPLGEVVLATVIDAVEGARQVLFGFWDQHRTAMDPGVSHDFESIEARMVDFVTRHGQPVHPVDQEPADAAGSIPVPALPTVGETPGLRPDEWMVLARARGIKQKDLLAEFRARAADAGLQEPSGLRAAMGAPRLASILLEILSDHDGGAVPGD